MASVITKEFEGQEIFFKNEDGQPKVRIDEVAKFCGWTKKSDSGNEVINWTRVRKHLSDLGMVQKCTTGDFIPEYIMYPLIGKANNGKATKFMMWVGEVLTQLRSKGVVILDHAEEEAIDFEKKFGKYRIRRTFTNSANVLEDYKQFMELSKQEWKAKRLDNKERVKMSNIIVSAVADRINNNVLEMKASEILQLQELISDIKTDVIKLSNKKNGGDKTAQTKKIKELERKLSEVTPLEIEDYFVLPYHPFSENRMYEPITKEKWCKTHAFKTWCDYFPYFLMPKEEELGVDWEQPIKLFLAYDHLSRFDSVNFHKSAIDMIFKFYGQDDNIINEVQIVNKTNRYVSSYGEGKIYFYLTN